MMCERCKKNEATLHYKNNVNGVVTESYLCMKCANEVYNYYSKAVNQDHSGNRIFDMLKEMLNTQTPRERSTNRNMHENFTQLAKNALNNASNIAQSMGHIYVGSEHLLLGILTEKNCVSAKILESRGITFENMKNVVSEYSGMGDRTNAAPLDMSPRTHRILTRSLDEARSSGDNFIGTEHILMAIIKESDCMAVKALISEGVNINLLYHDILAFFQSQEYAATQNSDNIQFENFGDMPNRTNQTKFPQNANTPVLNQYGKDLTMLAKKGKLDPIIGREKEMERVIQILSRRTKNNPCLIGEPGVGKTAVVEGLAQKILEGNVPDTLLGKRVVTLDLSSMIAGAKYRGEFEERLKNVMEEIKKSSDVIIFIDEIHTIIGAGAAEGAVDAANILKPALARGEMQVIGATTIEEYRRHIEKDAALERRFQCVIVGEPTADETIQILKGLRERYEEHHKIKITDEAIDAAVKLSARYINDRYLPDKAIDLIDEAASKARINALVLPSELKELENEIKKLSSEKEEAIRSQDFECAAKMRDDERKLRIKLAGEQKEWTVKRDSKSISIGEEEIADIVTSWTNIPVRQLLKEEAEKLVNLESLIHKRIIGQDEAVNAVSRAIRRSRVGLKDPKRPSGSFIFLGPTGVGKTEVCRALSEILFGDEQAMIRVDMSEFMEKHSVSKLIGSPPGYIGYDDAGQLTEKIRKKPYSVILFDEIEKAHPDIFNILLQILEDGILTDSHGRKVDFKNTVIIMTSNVGTSDISNSKPLGFSSKSETQTDRENKNAKSMEALKAMFKPEFINRIDEIIIFNKLTSEDIKKITVKMLEEISERIKSTGVNIKFDEKCVEMLSETGYDPIYGARPLRRAIQRKIEDSFSMELLEGKIKSGDNISASVTDDGDNKNIVYTE